MPRKPPPPRRAGRPSPAPPPLLFAPGETLEGAAILDEFRGPLGVLLWQAARDATLWASTPAEERAGLFDPVAHADRVRQMAQVNAAPVLEEPLRTFSALVASPSSLRADSVAAACRQVSGWAEGEGTHGTALAFAQAAALTSPGHAEAALASARIAALCGDAARAEAWYRRTVVLARKQEDRLSHVHALAGLARLRAGPAEADSAHRLYLMALRLARRKSFRNVKAELLLEMFAFTAKQGWPQAETYAIEAFGVLGPAHPRLSSLIYDVASFRLDHGKPMQAVPLLQALLPYSESSARRATLFALIARAAALADDRSLYRDAAREAWEVLRSTVGEDFGGAYLELARAAVALEAWPEAEQAGQLALEAAMRAGDEEVRGAAEELLKQVWLRCGGMRRLKCG